MDDFVKSPISALRAISQNFTYARYAAFFGIAQALILNFLQSRRIATFYEFIKMNGSNGMYREKAVKHVAWTVFAVISILAACQAFTVERGYAMKQNTDADIISLPEPAKDGAISVEKALTGRRSTRSFAERPLTRQDVAQLLWAAQGITGERGFRTAPSAGALFRWRFIWPPATWKMCRRDCIITGPSLTIWSV